MQNYNLRYPTNQKATYRSGDNVDLVMSFPGMSLLGNSVRISGILNVYKSATTAVAPTDKIYYDAATGINSFINNVVVSSFAKGTMETQSDYPRWVKMMHTATKTSSEMVTNSRYLTQLICQDDKLTPSLLSGPLPFTFKIYCCLNNVGGNPQIGYSTTGDLTISFRVVQPVEALYGADVTSNTNFTISNLCCEYMTMPEAKQTEPTYLLSMYSVKQIVNSVNASVQVKLPAAISKMSASFMRVAEELQNPYNNLELERLPGLYKLYYTFNDTTNQLVTYPIESNEDILEHYLDSFMNNSIKNSATLNRINNNKFYGVGLDLGQNISLAQNSLGVNVLSQVASDDPYYMYAYFLGISQL